MMADIKICSEFMGQAIEQAKLSYAEDEVPVGAIVVYENKIIGIGRNKSISKNSPIAHAEIIAIEQASNYLKNYRLINCDLYVTLEPCMMCAAAISQARIRRLYFGADDLKYGSINGNINYFQKENTNHLPEIYDNICSENCNRLLINFFKERR